MQRPRTDGLSSSEEFDALTELEDAVCGGITASGDIVYVGRNTSDGNREFFFYARSRDSFEKSANSGMQRHPSYAFDIQSKPDSDWDAYFRFLYPSPRSMQLIMNRRVRDSLEGHGDQLTISREIDHRVYFKTLSEAEKYANWLRQNDFEVTTLEAMEDDPSRIVVDFVREDVPNDIDPVVLALFDNAVDLNGDYDGWGCEVQGDVPE